MIQAKANRKYPWHTFYWPDKMASDLLCCFSGYITIHKDKMADTSPDDKEMKNFMRSKIFMFPVKNGEFQCIDHSTDGTSL